MNFLKMFIYFERERETTSRGGAEREGERTPSRLLSVSAEPIAESDSEPEAGLSLMNCEIMT